MLHPKDNRLDYGKLLMPPVGYNLTKAIGTTYSLDLDTLMIMPVAMFYSESIDRPKDEIRIDMVDAIVNAANKISVYYQQGKLKVPKKYHYLRAFWEKHIHEIRMPTNASSFHPKVWIIRFDCELYPTKYRLIITSRNLTFANDYDIAFCTDGEVQNMVTGLNPELVDFLNYLNKTSAQADNDFIEGLKKVKFDVPPFFADLVFHPIGIPSTNGIYSNPIFGSAWQELLAISPFVDNTTIKKLTAITTKPIHLLGNQEEISCLNVENLNSIKPWQFAKYIEQSAFNVEINENEEEPLPQSLHAKMYIGLQDNIPYWYLGSANCTSPAEKRNIEFLVELRATGRTSKPKDILTQLTDASGKSSIPIFETFQKCDTLEIGKQKMVDLQVRQILYNLYNIQTVGLVEINLLSNFYKYIIDIDLSTFSLPDGFTIKMRPVSRVDEELINLVPGTLQHLDQFKDYPEPLLTPFFAVYVYFEGEKQAESTWTIDIDLPSTRLNKIFTAIIESRERFMQYLNFLLNGEQAAIINNEPLTIKGSHKIRDAITALFDGKPVFESLLIAASRDTKKLKSIQELISRIEIEDIDKSEDQKIISKEFLSFWEVFGQFIKKPKTYA